MNFDPQPKISEVESVLEKSLNLGNILKTLTRESRIVGMEGEKVEDPVAQEVLEVGPETLDQIEIFLKAHGIIHLKPLPFAYGYSAVILDAGDEIVRISRMKPDERLDNEYVLRPRVTEIIGSVSVEICKKLTTAGITEKDVQQVQEDLRTQGYRWSDAGADNLAKDENGKLFIIDGRVVKE